MFGLNFNEFFEQKLLHKNHIKKIKHAKPTIDTSSPKSKLKCTKQPLSQFHRVYQMQSENKHLYHKISKPSSSIENKVENYTIIKNNRKQYYEQYERNLENFGLMRRIKSAKTNYSVKRLMEERKQNQQYLKLKSKFGYKDQVNLNFRYNLNMFNRHEEKLFSCRQENSNKVKTKKQQNKIISYSSRKTTKQTTLEQVKTRNNKYESLQVLN